MTTTPATAEPEKFADVGTARRVDRRKVVLLLMAALVIGIGTGLLWRWLAPPQTFLITVVGPFPATERSAGLVVSADAWFGVLAAGSGGLLGVVAALSRIRRAPIVVSAAVAGSVLQCAVMFLVGQLVANHRVVFHWAPVGGQNLPERGLLVLQAWPVLVLGPLFAVVVTLAAVGLSSPPAVLPKPADDLTGPPVA